MRKENLIASGAGGESIIRESRVRQTVRNAAIALAVIFGSLVLYFCLVPALAETGTEGYIYFDNGLSMYDTVEYSVNDKPYKPMWKLSEHRELMPIDDKNVNPEFVWVTQEEVTSGKITFKGTASGTVYDSVSNYQIDSASREWGYDYNDFVWTSDAIVVGGWNCYFAPALAMQYKYNGTKDGGATYQNFIKPVGWATDKVDDNTQIAFLNVSDFSDNDLPNFTKTINGVTFIGTFTTDDRLQVSTKSIGDKTFEKRIYTNGGSNGDVRVISFSTQGAGKVKVYAGGYSETISIGLYKKDSNGNYSTTPIDIKNCENYNDVTNAIELSFDEAGEYCIYGGRMYFYGLEVEIPGQASGTVELETLLRPYVKDLISNNHSNEVWGSFSEEPSAGYEKNIFRYSNGTVFTISNNMGYSTYPGPAIELSAYGVATREPSYAIKIDSVGSGILKFEANLPSNNSPSANAVLLKSGSDQVVIPNSSLSSDRKSYEVAIEKGTYYLGGDGDIFLYSVKIEYSGTSSYSAAEPIEAPVAASIDETEIREEVTVLTETVDLDEQLLPYLDGLGENAYIFGMEDTEAELAEIECPEPFVYDDGTAFEILPGMGYASGEVFTDGTASTTEYALKITARDTARLTFTAKQNESGDTAGELWLLGSSDIIQGEPLRSDEQIYEFEIPAAGDYYLGADIGSIDLSSVSVEYDIMVTAMTGGTLQATLDFTNFGAETIYSDKTINGFTIKADGSKEVIIETAEKNRTDGSSLKNRINFGGSGSKDAWSIWFNAEKAGYAKVYATSRDSVKTRDIQISDVNFKQKESKTATTRDVSEVPPVTLSFSEAGNYYISFSGGGGYIYRVELYYVDSSGDNTGGGDTGGGDSGNTGGGDTPVAYGRIHPDSGVNRTFYGYTYKMEGKTGKVNEVNSIGNNSQGADKEGSYATGTDSSHGLGKDYESAYNAKATFFDYYSDWELSGKELSDHKYFLESFDKKDYKFSLYKPIYQRSNEPGGTLITSAGDSDPNFTLGPITFSDSTNSVAYVYMGDLWNQAIRDYYKNESNVAPLYFGSNSWFTGNERFIGYDGKSYDGQSDGSSWIPNGITKELSGKSSPDIAYWYHFDDLGGRTYIESKNLTRFNDVSHGFSHSRAVTELAQYDGSTIRLKKSNLPMAYFNEEFILGKNDKNAVYGKVYDDVSFDFKLDNDGYYYYDSTKSDYATRLTLNTKSNKYYMDYTGKGVTKADDTSKTGLQFYPFNSEATNPDFYSENLMFGMKLQIPFVTYEQQSRRTGIFKFSGDDDVWIYIDNELALDIGGTHTAVGGVIDMKTGYAVVGSTYMKGTGENGNALTNRITNNEKAAFAIATMDGVYTTDSTNGGEWQNVKKSSFFDDTFEPKGNVTYKAVVDGNRYKVNLNGEITYRYFNSDGKEETSNLKFNGNEEFSFALTSVEKLQEDHDNSDGTVDHTLNIYYMERGLNSSNFKLAFKLAQKTEREAEKRWADAEVADHSGDFVTVQLYRALKRTVQAAGDIVYDFESDGQTGTGNDPFKWYGGGGSSVTRTSVESHSGNISLKSSDRGKDGSWKGPQLNLPKSQFIPGESYSFGVWAMYRGSPTSTRNAEKYYTANFDSNDKQFWGGRGSANVEISSAVAHSGSGSLYVSGRTDAWNGAAISLDNATFKSGTEYSFNIYLMHTQDIDEVPYKLSLQYKQPGVLGDDGTEKTQYSTISEKKANKNEWVQLVNTNYKIPENAYDMQIYVETADKNYLNNFYIDDVVIAEAGAVIEGTDATITTADPGGAADTEPPKNFKLTLKYVDKEGETQFKNINTKPVKKGEWIELTGSCIMPEDIRSTEQNYNLYVETDTGNYDFYIDDAVIEFPYSYTTEVTPIGGEEKLSNEYNWRKLWEGLLESERINDEDKAYEYYIREIHVSLSGENRPTYRASYYDKDTGKKIDPVTLNYTEDGVDKQLVVYPVKKNAVVEIVNSPITDLKLQKVWIGLEDKRKPITVDIYDDQKKLIETVTLNKANEWKASVTGLARYRRCEDNTYEMIKYYAIETNPENDYIVGYSSPEGDFITLDSGERAYGFTATADSNVLTLTITNRSKNTKLFQIGLLKTSETDGVKIEGATFDLYMADTDGNYSETPIASGTTNADGELQFGQSGFEPDKTYKLVERQSALGYVTDRTPIVFTVTTNPDGSMSFVLNEPTDTNGTLYSGHTFEQSSDGYFRLTFKLTNKPYTIAMPGTGGGIVYLYAGAFGMMILSLILLTFADRRRDQ